MFSKIKRWFASKRGKNTVIVVLALALVISIAGQLIGWSDLGRLITGTTGIGMGGYSCLPTCVENDGRFLSLPSGGMASFGGRSVIVWVEAPIGQSSFELGIFDGDAGMDANGEYVDQMTGNWDSTNTEATYTLYADPSRDGTGNVIIGQWTSNNPDDPMPNNDWYDITVRNVEAARGGEGKYYYRFEATRPSEGHGINAFKLRSTGQLTSGRSDMVDSDFAIVAMVANWNDFEIIYPDWTSRDDPGESTTYDGEWTFYFDVPAGTKTISFWDGDFDRGTDADLSADTDDPNTVGIPPWANADVTVAERAGGKGQPADDYSWDLARREPAVWYEVIGPEGEPVFANEEPSGTEEWEKFVVTADPDLPDEEIDLRVESIPPGVYTLHIEGLDIHNTVWFRINYTISDKPPDDCPECPICEECPPTPECVVYPTDTPEPEPDPTDTPIPPEPTVCPDPEPIDLVYILDVSGSMDQMYPGSGKKLEAAQDAILELNDLVKTEGGSGSRVALVTFHSAGRGSGRPPLYPTDIKVVSEFTSDIDGFNAKVEALTASGGTPTAEALQKVSDWLPGAWDPNHLPVVILITDGVPTVDLQTYGFQDYDVQVISLYDDEGNFRTVADVRNSGKRYDQYGGQRAGEPLADAMEEVHNLVNAIPDVTVHAIAVQAAHAGIFNDGVLKYVAAQSGGEFYTAEDTDSLKESLRRAYFDSACGEKEPAGGDGGEKLPCASPRRNQYNVGIIDYFFYGLRYEFQSGTEIKNGLWDEYQLTLTQAEVEAMTEVKLRAKAGRGVGSAVLSGCDFTSSEACGSVNDRNDFFTFSFQGATDNGDGTLTLTFRVQCHRRRAISNVTIGLASGVTPSTPTDTYESLVCPE